MNNLDMYNRYAQPPKEALKAFNNGRFKGTDINPMWRIMVLTKEYGECGFGWYCDVNRMWQEESPNTNEVMVFCQVSLFVKRDGEWSKPIVGVGGNTFVAARKNGLQASDEAYKMAYTDALGIACKALGIGADVWWKANDSKYTQNQDDNAEPIICERCGKAIGETLIDGKRWSAEKVAKATRAKYGMTLCYSCKMDADRININRVVDDSDTNIA